MLKLSHKLYFKYLQPGGPPRSSIIRQLSSSTKPAEAPPLIQDDERLSTLKTGQSSLISSVFAGLQLNVKGDPMYGNKMYKKINTASSVDELLALSEGQGLSKEHALRVISQLASWSASGQAQLSSFQGDPRFIRMCKVLMKGNKSFSTSGAIDLSVVLNVTADDEASKLVSNISASQMVKVLSTLALKKRRSSVLLRTISLQLAKSEPLDIKQCADVLFSMATLNVFDQNLLNKIKDDICSELQKEFRTCSTVGSIFTSVGILHYRNEELLDELCRFVLNNYSKFRSQDIIGIFITLASVNYTPSNSKELFEVLLPNIDQNKSRNAADWLSIVWSLVVLNQAHGYHLNSVLNETFLHQNFSGNNFEPQYTSKLKLLNINAASLHIFKKYSGPRLSNNSSIYNIAIVPRQDVRNMNERLIETLRRLIQSEQNLQTNINTNMGFYIDARCLLDKNCTSLPINEANEQRKDVKRLAIINCGYHDFCKGSLIPVGKIQMQLNLLKAIGYTPILIPYNELQPSYTILQRVKYVEAKFKEALHQ